MSGKVPGGAGAELSLGGQRGVADVGHRGGGKGSAGRGNSVGRGEEPVCSGKHT